MSLVELSRALSKEVSRLRFGGPTRYVYNPLEYAFEPHAQYLEMYGGRSAREVILLGMNPGPWGMAQTGVPFGEVAMVRDWLGVVGRVRRPAREHPDRPILGFSCTRSEVSGSRLWGFARDRFGTPARFFERFFVANYCPLVFMESTGRNRTPDKLPPSEREPLLAICDAALRDLLRILKPRFIIGVGAFAEGRARAALTGTSVGIGRILHPSPASPAANHGWASQAAGQLTALGIDVPDAA